MQGAAVIQSLITEQLDINMMNSSRGVLRTIFSSIGQPHALAFIDHLNKHTGSCDALSFYCERSMFIYISHNKKRQFYLHKLSSFRLPYGSIQREEKRREEKRREEKRREEKRREEKRREEKRREETDIHFHLFIMTDINCQWQVCPHKSGVLSLKT